MRKQGSLAVALILASVCLLGACSSSDSSSDTTVDCTARGAGVDLHLCDLTDADLTGADLSRADLSRANLRSADLRGADLNSAITDYTMVPDVLWGNTTCPNGVVQSTECST